MRDYALTRATMNGQIGALPVRMVCNWWTKFSLPRQAPTDCTQADIEWAKSLPLDIDPLAALEDRLFRRSRLPVR
jgi:hypothetical protein